MKKGEKLFVVDLESVSLYSQQQLFNLASDDKKYYSIPFLYLIASYSRNKALEWADTRLEYIKKKQTGSWTIYCFEKI